MKQFNQSLLACALFVGSASVWAATVTTTMPVSATVIGSCGITALPLAFGNIPSPISTNVDVNTSVTATCTSGGAYTISLSIGSGAGATFAVRKMTGSLATLNYSLYTDAGRTTVWGDGTAGSSTYAGAGTGAAQTITVYGRVLSPQSVIQTTYTDNVIVTVSY